MTVTSDELFAELRAGRAEQGARRVDEARLREVLAFIEANPEMWDQRKWACGTTGCLAGWTLALADNIPIRQVEATYPGGLQLESVAARLLGLDQYQVARLFYFTEVNGLGDTLRHPTFAEFCERVEEVTGVDYKPVTHLTEQDYAG